MVLLDLYDVLAVASRVMGCDAAGAVRRADLDLIDEVLAEVRSVSTSDNLAVAAAELLGGLAGRRPFHGPNRRIAVSVTLQFVALNDRDLALEPTDELGELLDQTFPAGRQLADWLSARLIPAGTARRFAAAHGGVQGSKEIGMFERFIDSARRVVVLAQDEARALNHNYLDTEHLLLGLIREDSGIAAKVLANLGISAPVVRTLVEEIVGLGLELPSGEIPFTPRAKTVLELGQREAMRLNQNYIGTEHILLGLVREGEGVAAQVLARLGADPDKVRQQVSQQLSSYRSDTGLKSRASFVVRDHLADSGSTGGRRHLLTELADLLDENARLHDEVGRLRRTLRKHDLDPDN